MRKMFLLGAVAAAVMAACTKTDTVKQSQAGAISFDGAYIGYPTESRAVIELGQSLTTFQVFGQYVKDAAPAVQVFDNVPVTKGGDGWSYTGGLRPWIEGANYVFAAYAPANALVDPQVNENGYLTLTDYSVNNNQVDLIYAAETATGQTAGSNVPVQFAFKHLLSIVKVTFKSGFDAGTTLTVSDVSVNGIPSTATFTASGETGQNQLGGNWGAASGDQNYGLTIAAISEAQGTASDNIVVIPQTIPTGEGEAVTITFKVTATAANNEVLVQDREFTSEIPVTTISAWDAGFKYNYVAEITPESLELEYIQFTDPEVELWKDAEDGDQNLPLE